MNNSGAPDWPDGFAASWRSIRSTRDCKAILAQSKACASSGVILFRSKNDLIMAGLVVAVLAVLVLAY
jgi:hypothetical protein